jgi:hypothetical protein
MRTLFLLTLLFSQGPTFVMTGNSFRQEGVVNRARGNVVVKTDALELLADEVDYNAATGELEARGHVTVTPARPGAAAAPAPPSAVSTNPSLVQDLEAARATLARMTDLSSKGLVARAEVERAQAELDRLQAEAGRELANQGLVPRADAERTPPTAVPAKDGALPDWTIQTDALKLKLSPAGNK